MKSIYINTLGFYRRLREAACRGPQPSLEPFWCTVEPARLDVDPPGIDIGAPRLDIDPERLDFGPREIDIDSKRLDIKPWEVDFRPKSLDVEPECLNRGSPSAQPPSRFIQHRSSSPAHGSSGQGYRLQPHCGRQARGFTGRKGAGLGRQVEQSGGTGSPTSGRERVELNMLRAHSASWGSHG